MFTILYWKLNNNIVIHLNRFKNFRTINNYTISRITKLEI